MQENAERMIPFLSLPREKTVKIRGLAILMVVFGHLDYTSWSGAGGVALFLILSGYGLEKKYRLSGLKEYWKKRLLNVYFPYFLVAIFNIIAWRVYSRRTMLFSVLGLDFSNNVDSSMWYISYLFYWYCSYYLVCKLSTSAHNNGVWLRCIGIMIMMFPCWSLCRTPVWHELSGAKYYIPAFPIGVILCSISERKLPEKWVRLLWPAVLFISSAYMFRVYKSDYNTVYALAMAAQVIAASQIFSIENNTALVLKFLGRYAFPIYLVEYMLIQVKDNWFYRLTYRPLIDFGCICLILLAAVIYWNGIYKAFADILSGADHKWFSQKN